MPATATKVHSDFEAASAERTEGGVEGFRATDSTTSGLLLRANLVRVLGLVRGLLAADFPNQATRTHPFQTPQDYLSGGTDNVRWNA